MLLSTAMHEEVGLRKLTDDSVNYTLNGKRICHCRVCQLASCPIRSEDASHLPVADVIGLAPSSRRPYVLQQGGCNTEQCVAFSHRACLGSDYLRWYILLSVTYSGHLV